MLAADVLKHLQAQFPEQLVLYAPDLAQVLGKSEKALSHLVTRGQLPFQVKSVGGKKCVDIFQVADWLATGDSGSEEVVVTRPAEERDKPSSVRARRGSSGARSGIGAKLMEMRFGVARALMQNLACLSVDEQVFVVVLAEHLASLQEMPIASFAVRAVWWEADSGNLIRSEIRCYCDTVYDVRLCLSMLRSQFYAASIARVTVRSGRKKLFHALLLEREDWLVVLDVLS